MSMHWIATKPRRAEFMSFAGLALGGLILAALTLAGPASGAEPKSQEVDAAMPKVEVIAVAITPAALPQPALKYHLLPTTLEQTPGDAMPLFLKAFSAEINGRASARAEYQFDLDVAKKWMEMPLAKLPRKQMQGVLNAFPLQQMVQAARRERCEWDQGLWHGNVYNILLPETQDFRWWGDLFALQARLRMAEGKFDEAINSLQIGYSLARQISEQPFYISRLVGLAIVREMNQQVLTMCEVPKSPNLYWSLAALPRPIINSSDSSEYDSFYLEFPQLQQVRTAKWTPEQWHAACQDVMQRLIALGGTSVGKGMGAGADVGRPTSVSQVLACVPAAKADLQAIGYSQADLDAMPPAQILLLHLVEMHDRMRDDLFKWINLPYWQAAPGMAAVEQRMRRGDGLQLKPLSWEVLPGIQTVAFAFARTDRELAALQCIEALRLYAAEHDGKLPARLDKITAVPIPLNPVTGKPFPYRLEGDTAILDADGGAQLTPCPQYRITVAPTR